MKSRKKTLDSAVFLVDDLLTTEANSRRSKRDLLLLASSHRLRQTRAIATMLSSYLLLSAASVLVHVAAQSRVEDIDIPQQCRSTCQPLLDQSRVRDCFWQLDRQLTLGRTAMINTAKTTTMTV